MSAEDFDLHSLAQYLHLTPSQVQKMAERGKLPGRKLQGEWKFSGPEIHHWLEDRIGASEDDAELVQVESVLDRGLPTETAQPDAISVAELMPVEAIAVPLLAKTRNAVLQQMAELAAGAGLLWDPEKMVEALRARESLHPTALDNGVALLHPRRPLAHVLGEPFVALGITSSGVPFGSSAGRLTDLFFLIGATSDREHLRILARLSRLLTDDSFLEALREAGDAASARELIVQRDTEFP